MSVLLKLSWDICAIFLLDNMLLVKFFILSMLFVQTCQKVNNFEPQSILEVTFCSIFKHRQLYIHNFDFKVNDKYLIEPEITERCEENTRTNPCVYAPAVKWILLTDLTRPYIQVKGMANREAFVDQIINVCLVTKQLGLDIVGKVMFDALKNNLNFALKCPFNKVKTFPKLKIFLLFVTSL